MPALKYKFNVEESQGYLQTVFLSYPEVSTQKELASLLGIHEKTLSRILTGRDVVSVKTAKSIHSLTPDYDFLQLFNQL